MEKKDQKPTIEFTIGDDKIGVIRFNRVEKMNAMTFEMFVELHNVINRILD